MNQKSLLVCHTSKEKGIFIQVLMVKCSDLTNLLKKYVLWLCLTQKEFYTELDLNGS